MMGTRRLLVPRSDACALAMAGALLVAGLAGCSPSAAGYGRVAGAATPAPLRIWYGTDDPTERAWAQDLVHQFASRHPTVRVSLSVYALDDLITKMQLALGAGTPPDLVYTTPRGPGLPAYVRAGQLRDLSREARQRGWARLLRPGLLDAYNRQLAANGRGSGQIYAVPYVLACVAVLYNKEIFTRLHLSPPRTLAGLESLLARVKIAGLTPLGLGNADGWLGDDWWLTLVNARVGPAALVPELRLSPRFTFRAPPFRWAAVTLQRWVDQGYFTPDFGGLDAQDSIATFFEGHTAMQLISSTENSQILSLVRQTRLAVGIFPFPGAAPVAAPVMPQSGYAGWAIPRAARHPSAGLDFIDSMLSAQTAQMLSAHGMLPAYNNASSAMSGAGRFQADFLAALSSATPGVYLDGAPVPNLNATMEANLQLLLQKVEAPSFLTRSLEEVYASHGAQATNTRTDGEF